MAWHDTSLDPGPVPLWFQIANLLRSSIASGEFKPGDRLPSEAELNRAFAISRTTARAALDKLEQEGLIARASGRGSTVLDRRVEQPVNLLGGFAEDMRRRGLTASYKTLVAKYAPAPADVRDALEIGAVPAFQVVRLLLADDMPMGLSTSWIAPAALNGHPPPSRRDLDRGSLYQWLEHRCGLRLSGGHETIEARIVTPALAAHLGVESGSAALVATRLSRGGCMTPVEHAVIVYRADRYRFRLDLSQATGGSE